VQPLTPLPWQNHFIPGSVAVAIIEVQEAAADGFLSIAKDGANMFAKHHTQTRNAFQQ
jgi:hypothetical protein